jgi:hypothetical protein
MYRSSVVKDVNGLGFVFGIEPPGNIVDDMAFQCSGCGIGLDHPGFCRLCNVRFKANRTFFNCVICRAPFEAGKVHERCMQRLAKRYARGEGPPSYWRTRRRRYVTSRAI